MLFGSAKKVRYAVVAGGWFAQAAVLPGFQHATHAELVAVVSGDPEKRTVLGKKYGVTTYSYEQYDALLASGTVDAVYIVLPNNQHKEYAVRAAKHRIHVLCEKPLATSVAECQAMIDACRENGVKLMTAYRLHLESATLHAVDAVQDGQIGEPRLFNATFTQQVDGDNTRLDADSGGGVVRDIGIYCLNAARTLFQADPIEVAAFSASGSDPRFRDVPEMYSVLLRFPENRLAQFACGFGEATVGTYRVVGTKGDLQADPGFSFQDDITVTLTVGGKSSSKTYPVRDQVGAEIQYFADCVLTDRDPEPDGVEGLIDVAVIRAIEQSAQQGGVPVKVGPFPPKHARARLAQAVNVGAKPKEPKLVNAAPPGGG